MVLPALEQLVTEALSEGTNIGDVTSGEKHVADQIAELLLKTLNSLSPSDGLIMETIHKFSSSLKLNFSCLFLSGEIFQDLL